MSKVFEKRFPQALAIVEARKVTNYRFKPSGRTLWVVKGRKGEYQVMPDSMFCTCDDYYFRVMDNKKQLCYHLVAQQIAEALGQYGMLDFADSQYAEVTSKWSDPSYQMGKPAYLVRRSEISISPREESNICRDQSYLELWKETAYFGRYFGSYSLEYYCPDDCSISDACYLHALLP